MKKDEANQYPALEVLGECKKIHSIIGSERFQEARKLRLKAILDDKFIYQRALEENFHSYEIICDKCVYNETLLQQSKSIKKPSFLAYCSCKNYKIYGGNFNPLKGTLIGKIQQRPTKITLALHHQAFKISDIVKTANVTEPCANNILKVLKEAQANWKEYELNREQKIIQEFISITKNNTIWPNTIPYFMTDLKDYIDDIFFEKTFNKLIKLTDI